jgi:superkiller protein 3
MVGCSIKNGAPPKIIQNTQYLPNIPPETNREFTPQMVEEYARIHQISDLKTAEFYITHPEYAKQHPYKPTSEDIEFYEREFLERLYPEFKKLSEEKGFMSARRRYMSNPADGPGNMPIGVRGRGYAAAMEKFMSTDGTGASSGLTGLSLERDPVATGYEESITLYRKNELDEAIVKLKEAVRTKPDAPALLYDLGVMYMEKGDYANAEKHLRSSIDNIKGTAYTGANLAIYARVFIDSCVNLGFVYRREGMYEKAVDVLKEAIEFRPDDLGANWNLGEVYWAMGDLEKTAAQMNKYLKLDPDEPQAHNIIGLTYYCKGLYDLALKEFQTAEKLSPHEKQYSYNKALTLARLDRYDELSEALEESSGLEESEYLSHIYNEQIRENRAKMLYNDGYSAMESRDLDRAIELFHSALELSPSMFSAHVNLGVCYRSKDDTENQIYHFQAALKLKSDAPDIYYNLGLAYSDAKMYQKAAAQFRQAIALKQNFKDAHFNLGTTLYKNGDYSDAVKEFEKCLELSPKWFEAHLNAGSCYLKIGDTVNAVGHFEKAIHINPDSAEAYYNLGVAFMHNKNYKRAYAQFQKSLKADRSYRRARVMIKEIESYWGK